MGIEHETIFDIIIMYTHNNMFPPEYFLCMHQEKERKREQIFSRMIAFVLVNLIFLTSICTVKVCFPFPL